MKKDDWILTLMRCHAALREAPLSKTDKDRAFAMRKAGYSPYAAAAELWGSQ
jgi:hypothetical protein